MTYTPIQVDIDEYEKGTWVADLVSFDSFGSSGTFILPDGSSWSGTTITERLEAATYRTRVVGGANKLGVTLSDKFYSGNVTLSVAVGDICSESGEKFGSTPSGLVLNTFQRQRGTAAQALNSIADAFGLIWWIDRAGLANMDKQRPTGNAASGLQISIDVDSSVTLVQPSGVVLGVPYESQSANPISAIRHIHWKSTQKQFSAHIYPLPFLFSNPVQTAYDCHYSAVVESDNGDGTVDVFVAARFGVKRALLFCGVPGAKVTMRQGDQVTLGFFGGDPQKPYAVSMAQDTSATKQVARNTDPVKVTMDSTAIATLAPFITAPPGGGPCTGTPGSVDINGTIKGGTARISVGD